MSKRFEYTRDLTDEGLDSTWVEDVSYNDNNNDILVLTKDDRVYVYHNVPVEAFDAMVDAAADGDSVGALVNNLVGEHGPAENWTNDEWSYFWVETSNVDDHSITSGEAMENPDSLPLALRTEVQFRDNHGAVKFMRSTKTVEQAVRDYLTSVNALGLSFTLEAVHVYFV